SFFFLLDDSANSVSSHDVNRTQENPEEVIEAAIDQLKETMLGHEKAESQIKKEPLDAADQDNKELAKFQQRLKCLSRQDSAESMENLFLLIKEDLSLEAANRARQLKATLEMVEKAEYHFPQCSVGANQVKLSEDLEKQVMDELATLFPEG
ncbi:hypothetical protein CARUB_v10018189mg, partial [Capsella rubella]